MDKPSREESADALSKREQSKTSLLRRDARAKLLSKMKEQLKWFWQAVPVPVLPSLPLVRTASHSILSDVENGSEQDFYDILSCRAFTTYPINPLKAESPEQTGMLTYLSFSLGSPICDRYVAEILADRAVLCVADGCNWGGASRDAARRATDSLFAYLAGQHPHLGSVKEAGDLLVDALLHSHETVISSNANSNPWEVGTTTLLGAFIVPVADPRNATPNPLFRAVSSPTLIHQPPRSRSSKTKEFAQRMNIFSGEKQSSSKPGGLDLERQWEVLSRHITMKNSHINPAVSSPNLTRSVSPSRQTMEILGGPQGLGWECILVNVGDCKAFHWNSRDHLVTDITAGSRTGQLDPSDPGGRIGPKGETWSPDLRNLRVASQHMEEDDLVVLMSDGVYDNLDPLTMGKLPGEVDENLTQYASWSEAIREQSELVQTVQCRAICDSLAQFIAQHPKPSELTRALVDHCWQTTESSRSFMRQNPRKRLLEDRQLYPGKMDHATVLCLRVCHFIRNTDVLDVVDRARTRKS